MTDVVAALRRTPCCGCGGPLPKRGQLNVIILDRAATWPYPAANDVLDPRPENRAVSVECDACLQNGVEPKTAVEVRQDGTAVHHPIASLAELPERVGVPS